MGFSRGPKIVTDGLVLALDAGSKKSYPGSGTTWSDLSGNGNDGTLTNGVTYDVDSLLFDGVNDYVSGATPTQNSSAATLEVWYKTTKDEVFPGENRLLNIGRGAFPGVSTAGISLRLRDDKVGFAARKADDSGYWDIFTGQVVTDGAWKHVIGTFDTTSLKRYENGVLTQQTATGQPYLTADDGYGIGGDSKYFEGNIVLVRFYNKTLSAEEVLQNYNATKSRFGV